VSRPDPDATVVVAGATGHVGSALVERLLEDGRSVRCIARDASRLPEGAEAVEGDLRDRSTADEALVEGCVAYFLVHALSAGGSLADEEQLVARTFADAARDAGAARIVYLGGLVDEEEPELSDHMASRVEVGRTLAASGVQTVELRASIVIGEGSFSFELIRRLVDSLPVIVLPSWADNLAQPIALEDVVSYLVAAGEAELDGDWVFEIGGAEQITYRRLVEEYAEAVGARRPSASVPVPDAAADLAAAIARPAASELPGDAQEALKLFESLRHTTVVRDRSAHELGVTPVGVKTAIAAAL
jgi:uncharacterized protein YbjT (DUF2867 family)